MRRVDRDGDEGQPELDERREVSDRMLVPLTPGSPLGDPALHQKIPEKIQSSQVGNNLLYFKMKKFCFKFQIWFNFFFHDLVHFCKKFEMIIKFKLKTF